MPTQSNDQFKEKFRPDTSAIDQEVNAALEGVDLDGLYERSNSTNAPSTPDTAGAKRGRIISVGKDEVFVDFGGKSQGIVSILQFEDTEPVVGAEMDFLVDRYDPREGVLILNRKGATATNVTWETLEVGQVVEGTVTAVNKGGLELNIKGMRGFMPSGQVDLYFQPDISIYLNQKMTAEVMQFDREKKNLVLSRRNVLERDREAAKEKLMAELAEGQVRRGTVRNIMDFGAFVDLGGVDGLLHVSEMSFKRGIRPSDIVKTGDVLDVKVIRIDKETGKLSLSLKQALGVDPWMDAATKYAPGTQVTGRVTKTESFGAFVEVEEGLEGLLPVSEISWQRIGKVSDALKEGDTVRLVVLSLDPSAKRISFSLKQAGPDPWKTVDERYAQDMVVSGTVTRVVDFGAFVELEPGLEGLIHISELADQRVRSASDIVKPGQQVDVRVLDLDKEGRRMSLSLKRASGVSPGTAQGSAADSTAPVAPAKKKKRPQLRGGLDF